LNGKGIEREREISGRISSNYCVFCHVNPFFGIKVTSMHEIGSVLKWRMLIRGMVANVQGLIHISELSWDVVMTPESVVQAGTPVRCAVLEVNTNKGRISLSLKRLQVSDPPQRPA